MQSKALNQSVVAIVGSTGTGKSQLGIELALRFNGEIINADALQMYEGLPILTNKVSIAEQQGVPHHLLGNVSLREETWQVGRFVKQARRLVEDIQARGKLPIILGGTHYYVQALLFNDILSEEDESIDVSRPSPRMTTAELEARFPILRQSPDEIYDHLKTVDPEMAARRYKEDHRKVRRCLEIYLTTGRKASEVWNEQQSTKADFAHYPSVELESVSSPTKDQNGETKPRPAPPIIFWLHTPPALLAERLNNRVHTMLASGLEDEVTALETHANSLSPPPDHTRGIYIAIGYKEFAPLQSSSSSMEGTESKVNLAARRAKAIERTQAHTRQYANRQLNWLRNKLFRTAQASSCRSTFFILSSPNPPTPAAWKSSVLEPATDLLSRYLARASLPDAAEVGAKNVVQKLRSGYEAKEPESAGWERRKCHICGRETLREGEWDQHLQSQKHRRAVRAARKAAEQKEKLAARVNHEDESSQNGTRLEDYDYKLDDI